MVDENLLSHVADIVTAHVSNNAIPANDLAGLIRTVHATLAGLGATAEPVEEKRTPAVSVRASIKPDTMTCLECGAKAKMLKRHLATAHGQTPEDYRARWNLARDYPMVAPEYAARRKELALSIGLGRKPKVEAAPIPERAPPAKMPAKRKAAPAANKDVVASAKDKLAGKPKSGPRKKLKLALGGDLPAPQAETIVADEG